MEPRTKSPVRDRIFGVIFAVLVVLTAAGVTWLARQGYAVFKLRRGVGDTWFLAADGTPWFRLDEHRRDVPLDQIPAHLQHAFIAIEDHRFYRHPGVDPVGLARAAFRNLREPGTVEGGSTITQQLARTLFLSNRRTYGRKIREAILALLIEATLTKSQVLELYLNRVYLGSGLYGVETISQYLFGRPASRLTLAESALIAGLARAPATFSPWSNLEGAIARSHIVLARMRQEGYISEEEEAAAKRARIRIRPFPETTESRAGYAKAHLRQEFRNHFGGDHPPDWQVQTTFVPALQDLAERAVSDGLRRFGNRSLQAALVALDPATGDVLALVGGRDFRASQFNRATRSRRQPGSAFKPLLFAAALERGFTPVSVLEGLDDIPPQGPDEWSPRNASGEITPEMTLREALLESNNRAAAALQQGIGARAVVRLASDAGLEGMPEVPSLALGTGLVRPIDLTAAFAMFPNGGLAVTPRTIVQVADADGAIAFDQPVRAERVISPETAYQMVSMLSDVLDRGTGAAARRWGVTFPAGGKTGTTDAFKDAWFVGFTSNLVVGVWVGFDQPATIGRDAYGSRYALPIWSDFMRRASRIRRPGAFERPSGLKAEPLCRVSYLRPVDGCPEYEEYFKAGDPVPGRLCPIHKGSIKQRVRRTLEGFFSNLAERLRQLIRD